MQILVIFTLCHILFELSPVEVLMHYDKVVHFWMLFTRGLRSAPFLCYHIIYAVNLKQAHSLHSVV